MKLTLAVFLLLASEPGTTASVDPAQFHELHWRSVGPFTRCSIGRSLAVWCREPPSHSSKSSSCAIVIVPGLTRRTYEGPLLGVFKGLH